MCAGFAERLRAEAGYLVAADDQGVREIMGDGASLFFRKAKCGRFGSFSLEGGFIRSWICNLKGNFEAAE